MCCVCVCRPRVGKMKAIYKIKKLTHFFSRDGFIFIPWTKVLAVIRIQFLGVKGKSSSGPSVWLSQCITESGCLCAT